jgi:hypothetical protein
MVKASKTKYATIWLDEENKRRKQQIAKEYRMKVEKYWWLETSTNTLILNVGPRCKWRQSVKIEKDIPICNWLISRE